jgi:hypothetical protein
MVHLAFIDGQVVIEPSGGIIDYAGRYKIVII